MSSGFWRGWTPLIEWDKDARFSYGLYAPQTPQVLCIFVHGTNRDFLTPREGLIEFAEAHNALIMTPLFPTGLLYRDDVDSYKDVRADGFRYDDALFGIIEQVGTRYPISGSRFLLGGFSGGAQFAHRFFMLYPENVIALSLAAPGRVTLLDDRYDGWVGTRDFEQRYGQPLNIDAMRRVHVHMVVGSDDVEDMTLTPDQRYYTPDAAVLGRTRIARLRALCDSYERQGIEVVFESVLNAEHNVKALMPSVSAFFSQQLGQQPTLPVGVSEKRDSV